MDIGNQSQKDIAQPTSTQQTEPSLQNPFKFDSKQLQAYYEQAWIKFINENKPPFFFKSCQCCSHQSIPYFQNQNNHFETMPQFNYQQCNLPSCYTQCYQIHCPLCFTEHQKHQNEFPIKCREIPNHHLCHHPMEQIKKKVFYQEVPKAKSSQSLLFEKNSQSNQNIAGNNAFQEDNYELMNECRKCQNCQQELEQKNEDYSMKNPDSQAQEVVQESKNSNFYCPSINVYKSQVLINQEIERLNQNNVNIQAELKKMLPSLSKMRKRLDESNNQTNTIRTQNPQNQDIQIKPKLFPKNSEPYSLTQPLGGGQISCNCSKSKCLKMYCECFSIGLICGNDCRCRNCQNQLENQQRRDALEEQLAKNLNSFQPKVYVVEQEKEVMGKNMRGCKCTKSNCKKKYCECKKSGVECTKDCKCGECYNQQNFESSSSSENENILELDQKKSLWQKQKWKIFQQEKQKVKTEEQQNEDQFMKDINELIEIGNKDVNTML